MNRVAYYEVTDIDEEKLLFEALKDKNPILSDHESNKMLGN